MFYVNFNLAGIYSVYQDISYKLSDKDRVHIADEKTNAVINSICITF